MEPPALKLIQVWKVDEPPEPPCHVAVPLAHAVMGKNQSSTPYERPGCSRRASSKDSNRTLVEGSLVIAGANERHCPRGRFPCAHGRGAV